MNLVRVLILIALFFSSLVSCKTGTDRSEFLQFFLFWGIVLAPLIMRVPEARAPSKVFAILIAQIVAYVAYEQGVSKDFNIRPDLLLIFGSLAITFIGLILAIQKKEKNRLDKESKNE